MDLLTHTLNLYHHLTDWDNSHFYSNLLFKQRRILDFRIPGGFRFAMGKDVSGCLKSCYSLNLGAASGSPGNSEGSIGFLCSSVPIELGLYGQLKSGDKGIVIAVPENLNERRKEGQTDVTKGGMDKYNSYLLYGRLLKDSKLEYLYSKRFNRKVQLVVTGLSTLSVENSYVNYNLQYDNDKSSTEFSFTSDGALFGLRYLNHIGRYRKWAVGGELYYTAQENSGGLSLGARYTPWSSSMPSSKEQHLSNSDTVITFTFNPMMGHVSTGYTTSLTPSTTVSSRYDFNVYSFDSDLALGIEYCPSCPNTNHASSQVADGMGGDGAGDQLLKLRIGVNQGLGFIYQERFGKMLLRLGVMTELSKSLKRSIGLEVRYDW